MVHKASQGPRRRGRPVEFDREQVIQDAIGAFFVKGFDATTLVDLETATGVDRSTLYNSFGGKAGIYSAATSTYLDMAERGLFGPLHDNEAGDGYDRVLEFLGRLRKGLTGATVPGCLIVNDMAAGPDPAAANRYRSLMEEGLQHALSDTNGPDPDLVRQRTAFIAASVLGINLVSKSSGDPAEIDRHIDAVEHEVRRWKQQDMLR